MSDIFSAVKKIDLCAHIESVAGAKIFSTGAGVRRANPCPLCGHNDCFTIYEEDNTFTCFSCNRAGDIINFHRAHQSLDANLTAAKDLAKKYRIDTENPKPPPAASQKKAPARPTLELPKIRKERARELRSFLADYFHNELLENQKALAYQIQKRGHSMDTIRRHKIGITNNRYLEAALSAGFTETEMVAVSMAKKPQINHYPFFDAGFFVYPQFNAAGEVLHFTVKDPTKRNKYQLKRKAADSEWICYGQDALDQEVVYLTEGEDDRITLIERGGRENTAAVIGNMNTPHLLDWIAKNAQGKTFYLVFDPDDAGKKYAERYSTSIVNADGRVFLIDLSAYKKDIDEVLRSAKKPSELMDLLEAEATEHTPAEESDEKNLYRFASFEVLGEQSDGRVVFWSPLFRRSKAITVQDLSLDALCQVGGWEVRNRVSRTIAEGMIHFRSLKTWIICQAADRYLGNLVEMGQGIHPLKANRVIIINGDEAATWDGDRFETQEHPLCEGQFINWDQNLRWTNLDLVMEEVQQMTTERAEAIFQEVLDLVAQWRFAGSMDHFLMAGWIFAQAVQTIWDWRPQLWVSGASGSGKSLLAQLIDAIAGELSICLEGPAVSEAGLRQFLKNHAYMMILDEFEKSKQREKIIERLRSAGHGGKGAIGSTRQEAIFSQIRHMFMVCSIETGVVRAAEQYRFLQVHTVKDNTLRPTIPGYRKRDELQIKIIAYALWAILPAKTLIYNMPPIAGHDNRWVQSIAVPMSMFAVCSDQDPAAQLQLLIESYLEDWTGRQAGAVQEDEAALVQDILFATVRISETVATTDHHESKTIYTERTISQILENPPISEDHSKTLQAHGVKQMEDGALFLYPETIAKRLLPQSSQWKNLNLRDILLRAPGAERSRARIAGANIRGIRIPEKTWKKEGD